MKLKQIQLILFFSFPVLLSFCTYSSYLLGKTDKIYALTATAVVFWVILALEHRTTRSPQPYTLLQAFVLGLFHWLSRLNWCFSLYMLVSIKPLHQAERMSKSLLISFLLCMEYTLIRLSYVPPTVYNLLVSFSDLFTSLTAVFLIRSISNSENDNQTLREENNHLLTHDPLTGLLNFEAYHARLYRLVDRGNPFVHVLLDCKNLKSMNDLQGVQAGNETLKKVADFLKHYFEDALLIGRYQGDEFAVSMGLQENTIATLSELLDSILPLDLEMQVTYSYVIYPNEAPTKDELISLAESRLYQVRRKEWLKREEHFIRSEKLSAIGELAAAMAHEIRNPLTSIKGFLQLSKKDDYNIRPWYGIIESEITRMSELTAEFLQFSKPHITNVKIHSVQDCLTRVLHLIESQALLYGHRVECDIQEEPLYVEMDKEKIVQVLLNVIKNGMEAMNENGTMRISLSQTDRLARIEITDTGKGIPESQLEQIFHPFYTTKENGTGLGLSICQKIIQDHSGKMEVYSRLNHGTTFYVILPIVAVSLGTVTIP